MPGFESGAAGCKARPLYIVLCANPTHLDNNLNSTFPVFNSQLLVLNFDSQLDSSKASSMFCPFHFFNEWGKKFIACFSFLLSFKQRQLHDQVIFSFLFFLKYYFLSNSTNAGPTNTCKLVNNLHIFLQLSRLDINRNHV